MIGKILAPFGLTGKGVNLLAYSVSDRALSQFTGESLCAGAPMHKPLIAHRSWNISSVVLVRPCSYASCVSRIRFSKVNGQMMIWFPLRTTTRSSPGSICISSRILFGITTCPLLDSRVLSMVMSMPSLPGLKILLFLLYSLPSLPARCQPYRNTAQPARWRNRSMLHATLSQGNPGHL